MLALRRLFLASSVCNVSYAKTLTAKMVFFKRGTSNKRQEKPEPNSHAGLSARGIEKEQAGEKGNRERRAGKATNLKEAFLQDLKTHPSVLEQDDIYNTLEEVFETPEQAFIANIKKNSLDSNRWRKMRKNLRLYPSNLLIKLTKALTASSFKSSDELWEPLQNEFSQRLHTLSLEEIADIIVEFAFVNRHDRAFFRQIENELHEREDMDVVNIRLVEKFLYGFSYSNHGSSLIYNKIAKTIKIAQTEIPPMKLALFANYFSRASESIKGGFGVYQIAEKRIHERLPDFSFHELCKIAQLLLPQNIGSNAFYKDLESRLLEKFPPGNEITAPDLITLCKATSTFFFQNQALLHKLQDISINYMENLSSSQIENLLWAFSRAKRGSVTFYEKIGAELGKRAKLLKPRGLAFAYEGLCQMSRKFDVSKARSAIEEEILARVGEFKEHSHYLVKILRGMKATGGMTGPLFTKVTELLFDNPRLKFSEIVEVLLVIGDHKTRAEPETRKASFANLQQRLEASIAFLKTDQICAVYYAYTAANAWTNQAFFSTVSNKLPEAIAVPKHLFCQMMWAAVQTNRFALASEFVRVINKLLEFGDIRFFFDHDNFVRLGWSSIVISHVIDAEDKLHEKERFRADFWPCVREAILDINPNTLQAETLRLWLQVLNMLSSVIEVKPETVDQKVKEISEFQSEELRRIEQYDSVSEDVRRNVAESAKSLFEGNKNEELKINISTSFLDERKNFLDVAIVDGRRLQRNKIGIRILSGVSFLLGVEEPENIHREMETEIRILETQGWQMLVIRESFWKDMGVTQKHLFLKEQLGSFLGQEQKSPEKRSRKPGGPRASRNKH